MAMGGAIGGIYRDLSRFIGIYREIMEAVDEVAGPVGEAKASTQNQAWRRAYGRMGGRGEAWRIPSLFLGEVYDFDAFGGLAWCNFVVDGMGWGFVCGWGWWVSADGA